VGELMKKLLLFLVAVSLFGQSTQNSANWTTVDGYYFDQFGPAQAGFWDDFLTASNAQYAPAGEIGWFRSPSIGTASDWSTSALTGGGITYTTGHPGIIGSHVVANNAQVWVNSSVNQGVSAADLPVGVWLFYLGDYSTGANSNNMTVTLGLSTATSASPCGTAPVSGTGSCANAIFIAATNTGTTHDFLGFTGSGGSYNSSVDPGVSAALGWYAAEIRHVECVGTNCATNNTWGFKIATSFGGLSAASLYCISTRASSLPAACNGTNVTSATAADIPTAANLNVFFELTLPASADGNGKILAVDAVGLVVPLSR
jgi:hypothetical protein